MYEYIYKNKKIEIKNIDVNQYPQETLESSIFVELEKSKKFLKKELEEISSLSSETFMMNLRKCV